MIEDRRISCKLKRKVFCSCVTKTLIYRPVTTTLTEGSDLLKQLGKTNCGIDENCAQNVGNVGEEGVVCEGNCMIKD